MHALSCRKMPDGYIDSFTHRQFWTCSCRRPSRGGEGTSPRIWITMTCTDIARGRSRDGTDHKTTAVLGACRQQ